MARNALLVYLGCGSVSPLVLAAPSPPPDSGYIMNTQTSKYLFCDENSCTFQATPSQVFKKMPGHDKQFRWRIYNDKGDDSGQCLDRIHCHHSSSGLRKASCDHCGAVHWQYEVVGSHPGALAEDGMRNCLQDDGKVAHCSTSFAKVKFIPQQCEVDSQTITDLKCKDQKTGSICGASFEQGSVVGASSTNDCNACQAAPNSTTHCQFSLTATNQVSIQTAFSSATSIGLKVGAKFEEGLIFKAEETFEFSITETLTYGHSTTTSRTVQIADACSADIVAGTRESVKGSVLTGTMTGEFTATVRTKWKNCPGMPDGVQPNQSGKITISNVPTQSVIGSCTPQSTPCSTETIPELLV